MFPVFILTLYHYIDPSNELYKYILHIYEVYKYIFIQIDMYIDTKMMMGIRL